MKICGIWLKDYHQFKDVYIDFTHPVTGEPLEKICLIGKNGVGKSLLLKALRDMLDLNRRNFGKSTIALNLVLDGNKVIAANVFSEKKFYNYQLIEDPDWGKTTTEDISRILWLQSKPFRKYEIPIPDVEIRTLYLPSESKKNSYLEISDVPQSNLNKALTKEISTNGPEEISNETIIAFWTWLNYHIEKRRSDQDIFENLPENLNKTKKELIEEFDKKNPKILNALSEIWNIILKQCGLYFDVENAKLPVHLTDNLQAYIKSSKGDVVAYSALSTGIRNFIFKLGHIYSLYFNRDVKEGFLLVDEPENSLHPDFLYDLVDVYRKCITDKRGVIDTQFFVATHSPIIAAQFEPYERIILDWDEDGNVKAERGHAPVGDDPNDVLEQDFHVRNLLGKEGLENWKQYLDLKDQLRNAAPNEKDAILQKLATIGSKYRF